MKLGKEIIKIYNKSLGNSFLYEIKDNLPQWQQQVTSQDVDYIVKKEPHIAVKYFSHKLSEENIAWIAERFPFFLKEIFK